ncbi:MAG: NAD kinase [Xanthomonadales bacterium]|nr:NAD kinase [Xanthomonadales bacterium]
MALDKIAFVASRSEAAQQALRSLAERYGNVPVEDADVIVAIGGDGFMLQTLHRNLRLEKPIYGLMRGSVGFLMNQYRSEEDGLLERLERAHCSRLHPLRMTAYGEAGTDMTALAINEVSLLRQTKQAAKIRVFVNDSVKLQELICDGILLSTPAGSTAYNLSAHGPILPLGSNILALTPISPFRPRRWRGALLQCDARVKFEILEHYKRPVSATADAFEVRDVVEVDIVEAKDVTLKMLFDPEHNLEDRILNEQFAV